MGGGAKSLLVKKFFVLQQKWFYTLGKSRFQKDTCSFVNNNNKINNKNNKRFNTSRLLYIPRIDPFALTKSANYVHAFLPYSPPPKSNVTEQLPLLLS